MVVVDVEATVDCILQLRINDLEAEWVKQAFHNEYMEVEPLAMAVQGHMQENRYYVREMTELRAVLQPWLQGEKTDTGEALWTVLVENNIQVKNLMALLSYLMELGQKRVLANGAQKEACVAAANVYIALAATPGSVAFKVFHALLFQKAVDSFKMWRTLESSGRKRKPSPVRSSQGSQRGSKRKSKRSRQPLAEDDDEDNPFDEDDDDEDTTLTAQEVGRINRALVDLLRGFVGILEDFPLKQHAQLAYHCIQQMVELSKLEAETFGGNFNITRDVAQMRSVPELAFKGLHCLCQPAHGDPSAMLSSVFQYLMPSLLMLFGENNKGVAAQTVPRAIQDIKDQALGFICCLVKDLGEVTDMPLRMLIQHLCSKVPDKLDYRRLVAQVIIRLLREMRTPQYAKIIEWLHKYANSTKGSMQFRVFAMDLITLLLDEDERKEADASEETAMYLTRAFLLRMLIARASDGAPTVRAKAMANFAQLCTSKNKFLIKEIVTPSVQRIACRSRVVPTPNREGPFPRPAIFSGTDSELSEGMPSREQSQTIEQAEPSVDSIGSSIGRPTEGSTPEGSTPEGNTPEATPSGEQRSLLPQTPMRLLELTLGVDITMVDGRSIVHTLRRRAGDGKVNVRKAAIQALENIIRLDEDGFQQQDLDVLEERCRDPALSVRKQSMLSLNALLQDMPLEKQIQHVWLSGVLPMVIDRETGVQEKCLQIVEETFLNNLAPYVRSRDQSHHMLWSLLQIVASPPAEESRKYLQKACQLWSRAKKLKPSYVTAIQTHVGTENNAAAWLFLSLMVPVAPKFKPDFVLEYWHTTAMEAPESEYRTVEWVLMVMGQVAEYLGKEELTTLAGHLKMRLMRFDSPPELISATVGTLNKLCHTLAEDKTKARKVTDQWFSELLKACDTYLSAAILNEDQERQPDEDECIRHLYTLGEITQLCPTKTPKRVFMLVQSIIAAPVITSDDVPASQESSHDLSHSPTKDADHSGGSQHSGCSSQPQTQVLSQFRGSKMSSKIRSHAFIALGKLCLQNEDLAKKCVPAMARELETCKDIAVRNNVVVILSDLCIRYTTLVDRYVSNVSACLKDVTPLIRIQTLTLLTRLVQEDFLKWKGTLFFRVLSALVDDYADVRNFAQFWLVHLLIRRHPGIFFHHFIECIFYFNSYDQHKVFNKVGETEREKKLFSLKGKANESKRMKLYTFLLEYMTDEQKFQLTAKLSKEIMGAVVDGLIPLDADSSALLQDTLSILAHKGIKLSSMRAIVHDDPADEMERAAVVMDTAKKTIITQVFKKNVIENIVPTVVSLKHMLESHHSPVLKELMLFLRELSKDYKNEVQDILAADRQLAAEIEFDLRKFAEEEEKEQERLRAAKARAAAGVASPRVSPARSPQGAAPGTPQAVLPVPGGSPARHPTTARLHNPAAHLAGTPRGNRIATPLSTLAIMNSARRAMEAAKKTGDAVNSPRPPPTGSRPGRKDRVKVTEQSDAEVTEGSNPFKTPEKSKNNASRAISTPSMNLTLGNITFQQGDHNLSMIPPPSPIPSSIPGRFSSNQGPDREPASPSWTVRQVVDENGQPQPRDVIHMFSPDKPTPCIRKWNVKTPMTRDLANQPEQQEDGGGSDVPMEEEPAESRKRLQPEPAAPPSESKKTSGSDTTQGQSRSTRRTSRLQTAVSSVADESSTSVPGSRRSRRKKR